ncbi:MAG TPA: TspO/MBR family protein [Lautropia sp.]|nr:TspO/MBR family protein [Lautropia sp.]
MEKLRSLRPPFKPPMKYYLPLVLFLVLVLGVGLVIGRAAAPAEWYIGLAKPSFNPPAWVFPPAWTTLYIFIAIAGWRTWHRDRSGVPMKMWWGQLVFNFLWSPVFFVAHQIGLAFIVALLMLAFILAFIATSWHRDRVAAALFLPYAAWVGFASVLNASIWTLNR